MKKKVTFLIITIIALIVVGILLYIKFGMFRLDTDYKYIIEQKAKYPINTNMPLTTYSYSHYEIDLKKNIIKLRKTSVVDDKKEYNDKVIGRKSLTEEQKQELTKILKEVMGEEYSSDMDYYRDIERQNGKDYFGIYYIISGKQRKNVVAYSNELVDRISNIIKIEDTNL